MEENRQNRIIWNEAASRGLVLGGFSAACFGLKQLSAGLGETAFSVLSPIIWILQFAGCIFILKRLLTAFSEKQKVTNLGSYILGKRICLFSSLILAFVVTAVVVYIPDNLLAVQFEAMKESYSAAMDADTRRIFEQMSMSDSPGIVFFSQFIYAYAYGCILSAILSRKIPQRALPSEENTENQ